MSKIGIRVDGNSKIGTGHVMRCMAIARQCILMGNEVIFLVADNQACEMINGSGFETFILNSEWTELDFEVEKLTTAIKKNSIDVLLIDTYYVTKTYLETIRNSVKTVYIDDLFMFDYPVDVLVNYSAYADIKRYICRKDTKYYMGMKYAPLREQFQKIIINKEKGDTILVMSGGTDPYHMTKKLPEAILESERLNKFKLFVVQGIFAKEDELIKSDRVVYYKNIKDMANLMQQSKLAVSAGGTTLYELCACQIPTVTYSFVDNQIDNVKAFERLNAMPYAGDLRDGEADIINMIVNKLENLADEPDDMRRQLLKELVDGEGSIRIAKILSGIEEA